jgi:hypothetical protein
MAKQIKRDSPTILAMYRQSAADRARHSVYELVKSACDAGHMSANKDVILQEIGEKASRAILRHWKALPEAIAEQRQRLIEEVQDDPIRVRGLPEGSGS